MRLKCPGCGDGPFALSNPLRSLWGAPNAKQDNRTFIESKMSPKVPPSLSLHLDNQKQTIYFMNKLETDHSRLCKEYL